MDAASTPLDPAWGRLAAELAMRLENPVLVAKRHGIDKEALKALMRDQRFRRTVAEAAERFQSIHATATRVRFKAELATEQGIEAMFALMTDTNTPASARVQAFTALKSLTGLAQPELPAQGFTLKIVLPGEQAPVTIEAQALTDPPSADGASVEEEKGEE